MSVCSTDIYFSFLLQLYLFWYKNYVYYSVIIFQAVEVVSGLISRGEINSLEGLVSSDIITQIKRNLSIFSLKQRQELAICASDIYFSFPYEVGVMFPNEDSKYLLYANSRYLFLIDYY